MRFAPLVLVLTLAPGQPSSAQTTVDQIGPLCGWNDDFVTGCTDRIAVQAARSAARYTVTQARGSAGDEATKPLPGWMAGCWRQESAGRTTDEMWMAPGGGAMLGTSRTVAKGRTVAYEFMQIREDNGRIAFVAKPSGQAEASFALIKSGAHEVVFENPTHDFPQRVMYRLDGQTLIGRIEGTQNGKPQSVDYPMRKVACP